MPMTAQHLWRVLAVSGSSVVRIYINFCDDRAFNFPCSASRRGNFRCRNVCGVICVCADLAGSVLRQVMRTCLLVMLLFEQLCYVSSCAPTTFCADWFVLKSNSGRSRLGFRFFFEIISWNLVRRDGRTRRLFTNFHCTPTRLLKYLFHLFRNPRFTSITSKLITHANIANKRFLTV